MVKLCCNIFLITRPALHNLAHTTDCGLVNLAVLSVLSDFVILITVATATASFRMWRLQRSCKVASSHACKIQSCNAKSKQPELNSNQTEIHVLGTETISSHHGILHGQTEGLAAIDQKL